MKKINMFLIAVIAIAGSTVCALAYDTNSDFIKGGTAATDAVGAVAVNKAYVMTGTYDFSKETYDTNDIVQLVSVPAGVIPQVVTLACNDEVSFITTAQLYRVVSGGSYAAAGAATAFAAETASAVSVAVNIATTNPAATTIAGEQWGFILTLTTNGAPTSGKLQLSVIGYDAAPVMRE